MLTIEMRIQKLEATNRRYKTTLIVMIASFATIFMAFRNPTTVPDVVQAKRFEVVDDNGNVLVKLDQDNGKGISAEKQPNIFEPFFSTKEGGTGLGLTVSYNIVTAHGGTIELLSERGPGACFRIFLPEGGKQ